MTWSCSIIQSKMWTSHPQIHYDSAGWDLIVYIETMETALILSKNWMKQFFQTLLQGITSSAFIPNPLPLTTNSFQQIMRITKTIGIMLIALLPIMNPANKMMTPH